MTNDDLKKMLAPEAFKTAAEAEAAGRLIAQGYASEMRHLAEVFGLGKEADEVPAKAPEKKETVPAGEMDLDMLLKDLGGIAG